MTNVTLPVSLRRIKKKNGKKSFRGIDNIKRFIDIQSLGVGGDVLIVITTIVAYVPSSISF